MTEFTFENNIFIEEKLFIKSQLKSSISNTVLVFSRQNAYFVLAALVLPCLPPCLPSIQQTSDHNVVNSL